MAHGRPKNIRDPVDVRLGLRVKQRRLLRCWSQEELGKAIGITYQQVQKYETGSNRIAVSRLVAIAEALVTPLEYFYKDISFQRDLVRTTGFSDMPQALLERDPFSQKDIGQLIRAYTKIKNPDLKKQLLKVAKAMAEADT